MTNDIVGNKQAALEMLACLLRRRRRLIKRKPKGVGQRHAPASLWQPAAAAAVGVAGDEMCCSPGAGGVATPTLAG